MRRINKDDCRNAANKLSEFAFDKKIEEIGEEFKVIGDKLVNAYIPKPLIALSKEYPDLFIDKKCIYEITGVCPICGGYSFSERKGVVKIADAIVKPKYLLLLCELATVTGGRVLLLNRGDAERQRLYFQIGEDIEMVIMQVRPSVARQEELLFELKID